MTDLRAMIIKALRQEADRLEAHEGHLFQPYYRGQDGPAHDLNLGLEGAEAAREQASNELEACFDPASGWYDDAEYIEWGVVVPVEVSKEVAIGRGDNRFSYMADYKLRPVWDTTEPEVLIATCPECGHEEPGLPGSTCSKCGDDE